MPLNSVNFWASTRGAHRNTCRQVPSAGVVHGAVVPNGRPVSNGGRPCGVSDGVATKQGADALPCNQFSSAARKKKRKKKSNKKRSGNRESPPPPPPPPPLEEEEEEDWEREIQEVSVVDWGEMCFGTCSYGPEDVLDWSMQSSTLKDWGAAIVPVRSCFKPSVSHPQPVQWFHLHKRPETDQFEDAEE